MNTTIHNQHTALTPWRLRWVGGLLRGGAVIAYPTETVYGLGCDPLNIDAIHTILDLKQRPIDKGLILVGSSIAQLAPYVAPDHHQRLTLLDGTPATPTTWLMPAHPAVPYWLTGGHRRIALRITRHPVAARLCQTIDRALVSTSANPGGRPPACTTLQVRRYFGKSLDYIVSDNSGLSGQPSEIRDAITGTIIRG